MPQQGTNENSHTLISYMSYTLAIYNISKTRMGMWYCTATELTNITKAPHEWPSLCRIEVSVPCFHDKLAKSPVALVRTSTWCLKNYTRQHLQIVEHTKKFSQKTFTEPPALTASAVEEANKWKN